jgi:hypothetical protein
LTVLPELVAKILVPVNAFIVTGTFVGFIVKSFPIVGNAVPTIVIALGIPVNVIVWGNVAVTSLFA